MRSRDIILVQRRQGTWRPRLVAFPSDDNFPNWLGQRSNPGQHMAVFHTAYDAFRFCKAHGYPVVGMVHRFPREPPGHSREELAFYTSRCIHRDPE